MTRFLNVALLACGLALGAEPSLRPAPFKGRAYKPVSEPGSQALLYTEKHDDIMRGGVSLGRTEKSALRLLVDPILVTYDAKTHRVRQYRGLSHVNNSNGKSFPVRIEYPEGGP